VDIRNKTKSVILIISGVIMNRELMLNKLEAINQPFDFVIIGGGASGIGIVLEAVSRGYSAVLFEKSDFVKSTSSKSTKLVHGGVRYLAQGDIALVREACVERGLLLRNAPHLVRSQPFVIPTFGWFDEFLYTVGLTLYDLMAGRYSLRRSKRISKKQVLSYLPTVKENKLTAGILYYDGQFDDARLAVNVLQTATGLGAVVVNYMPVEALIKDDDGKLQGVKVKDEFSGKSFYVKGRFVINATGVFADDILQMDRPGMRPTMRPSQGIHIVLDKSFLPGFHAVMIPKTEDGRVLFFVPWHGRVVVGTTDTPIDHSSLEPVALEEEIEFILSTSGKYLKKAPKRSDVLSIFAGLRPLAATKDNNGKKTREISRNHKIIVSSSGLMTMIGGKWTTFRRMAEDIISRAEKVNRLKRSRSVTRKMKVRGYMESVDMNDPYYVYGSDKDTMLDLVKGNPVLGESLSESLQIIKAQVVWAVREEMAMNVEDVLSRRTRCQLLDARESIRMAPEVASIMADEMGKDQKWVRDQVSAYEEVTGNYFLET
jgi:glycerol-3-phosphate dehydrogenase